MPLMKSKRRQPTPSRRLQRAVEQYIVVLAEILDGAIRRGRTARQAARMIAAADSAGIAALRASGCDHLDALIAATRGPIAEALDALSGKEDQ